MTHQQRTTIRAAINNAKRAWLQTQGGYRKVEDDIQGHELRLRRQAGEDVHHGTLTKWRKGCRCAPCMTTRRNYAREWARRNRPVRDKPPVGYLSVCSPSVDSTSSGLQP